MDPDPGEVKAFGVAARRYRKDLGLSGREVARRMSERLGREVKHQSVYQWEKGQNGPGDVATAYVLDEVLEAKGALAGLLFPTTDRRLSALEERAARTEAAIDRLLRAVGLEP